MTATAVAAHLREKANKEKALFAQRYFKTGPGEYAHGDIFIGITVPEIRKISRQFRTMKLSEVAELVRSPVHEDRLAGLLILVYQFEKVEPANQKKIYDLYLRSTRYINNWDLVDTSAPHIVGAYLLDRPRAILRDLAKSPLLWERRIAILATQKFIRANQFDDTLALAELLVTDTHDLIHKAVGWMLREVGERSQADLTQFLAKHYRTMPRTMLRYAIEKFPPETRKAYLAGTV